ncbi:MAG: TspO/MBR family protein [Candidatus Aenigmatarchaeota archaeon]
MNKPWFQPPGWLFGPMWTTLYILMGISLYLIWKEKFN